TGPKAGAGTPTEPKVPAQPTARPAATNAVGGDAKTRPEPGDKAGRPVPGPVSPGSAGAESPKAVSRPSQTPGNTEKAASAPAEAAAKPRQPETRSTTQATVTGAQGAAGERPHAGPARKDQQARPGDFRPDKKRPKPNAGSDGADAQPQSSNRPSSASRDN